MEFIAFDSHKRYTQASVASSGGNVIRESRIPHEPGAIRAFLATCESASPVAVEAIGNWYWIVDEIEQAEMFPKLVHPRKAKLMMGMINKTDKLDARGMNRLQINGTLPTVWIPPGALRDQRDLPRTRMILVQQRTRLKNRVHATLAKYALSISDVKNIFDKKNGEILSDRVHQLPTETRYAKECLLEHLSFVGDRIVALEKRMREVLLETPEVRLLMSLPGIGFILAVVIALEIGDISRFPSAPCLASYAGTTPRVHSSGGKTRYGHLRTDVSHYLKWAFVEAANTISMYARHWPDRHVVRLYRRLRERKGHQKAVGAVARHLAEASFGMLKRNVEYMDPALQTVPSTEG